MSLNPISARLRVVNKSNGPAKVQVSIGAGEVLEVSTEVADVLTAASPAFAVVPEVIPVDETEVSGDSDVKSRRARKS